MENSYRRGDLLRHLSFRAKVDAIAFRAESEPVITKTHFKGPVHGVFGLHDPVRRHLEDPQLREQSLVRLEIAIDIGPGRSMRTKVERDPELWEILMRQVFFMMCENLYPWRGPGIKYDRQAVRSAKKGTKTLFHDSTRPPFGRSFYMGHKWDPAYLLVYHKVQDQDRRLPRHSERVRVELVLDERGCRMLGISTVGDLLTFDYRTKLAAYFHAIRPRVRARLFAKVPKALRTLLISRVGSEWTQAVWDHYRDAGSHALHIVNAADTGKNAGYEALNREMRRALVNILRTRA